ncbi:MAG: hypothetical protein WBX25_04730 [Rhodomicrobium sp.]
MDNPAHPVFALAVIGEAIKSLFAVGDRVAPAKHQHPGRVAPPFDAELEHFFEAGPFRSRVVKTSNHAHQLLAISLAPSGRTVESSPHSASRPVVEV